jgi:hypothetical protein
LLADVLALHVRSSLNVVVCFLRSPSRPVPRTSYEIHAKYPIDVLAKTWAVRN